MKNRLTSHAQFWHDKLLFLMRLLETGCIREVEREEAHIISPLSVAENSEKLRLILDLRYMNSFLSVPKFKYEDVCSKRDLFQ